jgi:hypothetical protein
MKHFFHLTPSRSDLHFIVGALLAVGVVIVFVACVHAS